MEVNFKFDYVLTLHDRNVYKNNIEQDGVDEEISYKLSKVKVNKRDIKDITKSSDGSAVIMFKNKFAALLKTLEEYDDIIEVIRKADLAVDIMHQEKIYIFDDFNVEDEELNICESWSEIRNDKKDILNIK
jgi:effector-binding domain-containing protein